MKPLQKIKPFRWGIELVLITFFQLISFTDVMLDAGEFSAQFIPVFGIFLAVEWAYTLMMRIVLKQTSFELEFIAFFLSSVGLSLVATIDTDALEEKKESFTSPYYAPRQLLFIILGVVGFIALRWVIANADRVSMLRLPAAAVAGLLLAANIVLGEEVNGAKNWINIGSFSIQPSEFVKVLFIFVGAATLDKLQTTRSIIKYMIFAVGCIGALFIMKDFGTAVIFFVTFLIITFMRSGDFRAIILICIVAVVGALLILYFKPVVAQRFANYRHVWDSPYGAGMQQTRLLTYSASGGLFGLGLGKGMLRYTFAATTDLIFGMVCEEYGLVIAFSILACFAAIVVYTVAGARGSRSTFYAIAACASSGLLIVQVSLNVFGVTDLIPWTGVTLPFISRGGSSLMCCWMLMAYIKSIDPRAYPKTLKETQALV